MTAEQPGHSIFDRVKKTIATIEPELIDLRVELHQIPETGLDLPQTNTLLRSHFETLGLEIRDAQNTSGFTALLRGGIETEGHRPLVLLRADMDGLPVTEDTHLSWASTNGNMHGCGHDMHMTAAVGAARALVEVKDQLAGDVVFFLQPGEEGDNGAQHLMDEGLLEIDGRLPDHAYSLHVWSANYPAKSITARPGPLMASSDIITLTVKGKGGHGSAPHLSVDPIPAIAEMITQSQVLISREFNIFDPVVVSCGKLSAGNAANVIAETATAEFTVRTFSAPIRARLLHHLSRTFNGIAQAHGVECVIDIEELYPVTYNDPDEYRYASSLIAQRFPHRWSELEYPVGAAEDFSKVLQKIPGVFVFVSAVPEGMDHNSVPFNHAPGAIYDSASIKDCAQILADLALGRLVH